MSTHSTVQNFSLPNRAVGRVFTPVQLFDGNGRAEDVEKIETAEPTLTARTAQIASDCVCSPSPTAVSQFRFCDHQPPLTASRSHPHLRQSRVVTSCGPRPLSTSSSAPALAPVLPMNGTTAFTAAPSDAESCWRPRPSPLAGANKLESNCYIHGPAPFASTLSHRLDSLPSTTVRRGPPPSSVTSARSSPPLSLLLPAPPLSVTNSPAAAGDAARTRSMSLRWGPRFRRMATTPWTASEDACSYIGGGAPTRRRRRVCTRHRLDFLSYCRNTATVTSAGQSHDDPEQRPLPPQHRRPRIFWMLAAITLAGVLSCVAAVTLAVAQATWDMQGWKAGTLAWLAVSAVVSAVAGGGLAAMGQRYRGHRGGQRRGHMINSNDSNSNSSSLDEDRNWARFADDPVQLRRYVEALESRWASVVSTAVVGTAATAPVKGSLPPPVPRPPSLPGLALATMAPTTTPIGTAACHIVSAKMSMAGEDRMSRKLETRMQETVGEHASPGLVL